MKRPGFALILAITLLLLVAAAMTTFAAALAMEARRTRAALDQAQLRQVQLWAAHELAGPDALPVELRPPVPEVSVVVASESPSPDVRLVRVVATLNQSRLAQQLELHRQGTGWRVASSTLAEP